MTYRIRINKDGARTVHTSACARGGKAPACSAEELADEMAYFAELGETLAVCRCAKGVGR